MNPLMTTGDNSVRYFGRCPVKGCRHRRVIEETSNPNLVRHGDVLEVRDANGKAWPLYFIGGLDQLAAMRHACFVCPEHDRAVYFEAGQFTYDPSKVCNAKCTGATGPACSCSCRGKNHGGKFS